MVGFVGASQSLTSLSLAGLEDLDGPKALFSALEKSQLQSLSLTGKVCSGVALDCLSRLLKALKLKELSLNFEPKGGRDGKGQAFISALQEDTFLEKFSWIGVHVSPTLWEPLWLLLTSKPQLQSYTLSLTSSDQISWGSGLKPLPALWLDPADSSLSPSLIKGLTWVERLTYQGPTNGNECLMAAAELLTRPTALRELTLKELTLKEEALQVFTQALKAHPEVPLTHLTLTIREDSLLTHGAPLAALIEALSGSGSLRELRLEVGLRLPPEPEQPGGEVGDPFGSFFASLKGLRGPQVHLGLRGPLGQELGSTPLGALGPLLDALPQMTALVSLDLSRCALQPHHLEPLGAFLAGDPALLRLSLSHNPLEPAEQQPPSAGLLSLGRALGTQNQRLEELDLSHCGLSGASLKGLLGELFPAQREHAHRLKGLVLAGNPLRGDGARALMLLAQRNLSITSLDLGSCEFDQEPLDPLRLFLQTILPNPATAAQQTVRLSNLGSRQGTGGILETLRIGGEGVLLLLSRLRPSNSLLRRLDLSETPLERTADVELLRRVVGKLPHLHHLELTLGKGLEANTFLNEELAELRQITTLRLRGKLAGGGPVGDAVDLVLPPQCRHLQHLFLDMDTSELNLRKTLASLDFARPLTSLNLPRLGRYPRDDDLLALERLALVLLGEERTRQVYPCLGSYRSRLLRKGLQEALATNTHRHAAGGSRQARVAHFGATSRRRQRQQEAHPAEIASLAAQVAAGREPEEPPSAPRSRRSRQRDPLLPGERPGLGTFLPPLLAREVVEVVAAPATRELLEEILQGCLRREGCPPTCQVLLIREEGQREEIPPGFYQAVAERSGFQWVVAGGTLIPLRPLPASSPLPRVLQQLGFSRVADPERVISNLDAAICDLVVATLSKEQQGQGQEQQQQKSWYLYDRLPNSSLFGTLLCQALTLNAQAVTRLSLSSCLRQDAFPLLASALTSLGHLETLELEDARGLILTALSPSLPALSSLETLSISRCDLTEQGLLSLCHHLCQLPSPRLTTLSLSSNREFPNSLGCLEAFARLISHLTATLTHFHVPLWSFSGPFTPSQRPAGRAYISALLAARLLTSVRLQPPPLPAFPTKGAAQVAQALAGLKDFHPFTKLPSLFLWLVLELMLKEEEEVEEEEGKEEGKEGSEQKGRKRPLTSLTIPGSGRVADHYTTKPFSLKSEDFFLPEAFASLLSLLRHAPHLQELDLAAEDFRLHLEPLLEEHFPRNLRRLRCHPGLPLSCLTRNASSLQQLELVGSHPADQSAKRLIHMDHLACFYREVLTSLAPCLTSLTLVKGHVAWEALMAALPACPSLSSLALLDLRGLCHSPLLYPYLREARLTSFAYSVYSLPVDSLRELFSALRDNPSLTSLSFSYHTKEEETDLTDLTTVLALPPNLEALELSLGTLRPLAAFAKVLSSALRSSPSFALRFRSLSFTPRDAFLGELDDVFRALAEARCALQHLHLSDAQLSLRSWQALIAALPSLAPSLLTLDLSSCPLEPRLKKGLLEAFRSPAIKGRIALQELRVASLLEHRSLERPLQEFVEVTPDLRILGSFEPSGREGLLALVPRGRASLS